MRITPQSTALPASLERLPAANTTANATLKHPIHPSLIVDLLQFFRAGLSHPELAVRRQFQKSAMLSRRAIAESGDDSMVTAALLFQTCHMLSQREFTSKPWDSDSIIESGTLDWLMEHFGESVAETIRLQPHARRYLASVNSRYCEQLDSQQRQQMSVDGGEMSRCAAVAFAKGRFFSQAMQLARWIHQTLDQNQYTPDIDEVILTASRVRNTIQKSQRIPAICLQSTPPTLELPVE